MNDTPLRPSPWIIARDDAKDLVSMLTAVRTRTSQLGSSAEALGLKIAIAQALALAEQRLAACQLALDAVERVRA